MSRIDPKDCPFDRIVIHYPNGTIEELKPEEGKHFVVMSWTEQDEDIPEKPGHLLMHCGVDIMAKMIDRIFNKHKVVYENIEKLWAYQRLVAESQERLAKKMQDRFRNMGPKDGGNWN